MKTFKKLILFVVAVLVLTTALGVLVACDEPASATYTVTFKAAGQTVHTVDVNNGEKIKASQLPSFGKEGYDLEGWFVGDVDVLDYVVKGNVTANAKLTAKQYTVTFKNGETVLSTKQIAYGTAILASHVPAKPTAPEGKVFDGWYVGDVKVEAGFEVTGNITAVARFKDNGGEGPEDPNPPAPTTYTVTFKNGETVVNTLTGLSGNTTLTAAQIPNVTAPEGKEFEGWYVGSVKVEAGYTVTGDVTAVARFKDAEENPDEPNPPAPTTYTVTFKSQNQVIKTVSGVVADSVLTEEQIPETPDAPQYKEFTYWQVNGKYANPATYEIKSDTVFVANFKYSDGEEDGWRFSWYDGTYKNEQSGFQVYAYNGTESELTVPSTFHGQPVVMMINFRWANGGNVTKLTIGNNINSINQGALAGLNNLIELTIPFVGTCRGSGVFNHDDPTDRGTFGYIFRALNPDPVDPSEPPNPDEFKEPNEWFYIPPSLKKVTVLGDSLPIQAFSLCTMLEEIVLGDKVNWIFSEAFKECTNLKSVTMTESVTYLGSRAFENCHGLTGTEFLSDNITEIGEGAFIWCESLSNVVLPSSLEKLGNDTFWLTPWYNAQPGGLIYIGNVLYEYKTHGVDSLPETVNINIAAGTKVIREGAFDTAHERLIGVTIPTGIKEIPKSAFASCRALTSIVIPEGVTSIGVWAFDGCTALANITLPDSLEFIDQDAFKDTAWYNAQPVGEIAYIGDFVYKFKADSANMLPDGTEIVFKAGTKGIGQSAFYNQAGITAITLPSSIQHIGMYAFEKCPNLKKVNITDIAAFCGISTFLTGVFWFSLPDLYLNGVLVTDLVIPDGVTEIKDYVFNRCGSIESVRIPASVVKLGHNALTAANIKDVYYEGTMAEWNAIETECGFNNVITSGAVIHCSDGNLDLYGNVVV